MGSFQEWDFLSDLKSNSNNLSNSKFNSESNLSNLYNNNKSTSNGNGYHNGFGNGYQSNSNIDLLGGGNSSSYKGGSSSSTSSNSSTPTNGIDSNGSEDSKFITHTLTPQDTLQGLSIKYGVKVDEIKRINKIWSQDSLFLKKTLQIPKVENNNSTPNNNSINNSNNNNNSSNDSNSNGYFITSPTKKSQTPNKDLDHNNVFPEFERMSTSFGSTKSKPILPEYKSFPNNYGNENTNWTSIPVSTFSLSPVVTSLDQKTQNQFSLLDEEFNPL